MLSATEISVGCLADAAGISLVMPRNKYEELFLITSEMAVFLDGKHKFLSFVHKNNTDWKGTIVYDVDIELDESSIFDADDRSPPPRGAMIRSGTELSLITTNDQGRLIGPATVCKVVSGLRPCRDKMGAGFTRWQIVLGRGDDKRVLKTIDIEGQSAK